VAAARLYGQKYTLMMIYVGRIKYVHWIGSLLCST